MSELSFGDAWKIVKSKGPVRLPSVQQKVHAALKVVEPHLLDWERMHLLHDMREPNRRGFDYVCQVIENRIYRGIEFRGCL